MATRNTGMVKSGRSVTGQAEFGTRNRQRHNQAEQKQEQWWNDKTGELCISSVLIQYSAWSQKWPLPWK